MAQVFIPALMQDLTGGVEKVNVPAATVREVVDQLDTRFPGLRDRLFEDGQIRRSIAVVVDGEVSQRRERTKLSENSEVHFLPAISGGSAR